MKDHPKQPVIKMLLFTYGKLCMITSVTGLSLQTNNTFSGGFISASGRSPICKSATNMSAYSPKIPMPLMKKSTPRTEKE
jgi:hypothetical protein